MIGIRFDPSQVVRLMQRAEKQIRFASAVAITRTGMHVRDALKASITSEFDRPTPFTQRSTFLERATPKSLVARTWFKNQAFEKNRRSTEDILGHQLKGGARQNKALEEWLARAGYLSAGEFVAPGEGARLDRYGNISRGQITQILSQLRAGADQTQYTRDSARSKRSRIKAGQMFWSRGGRLARGVWMRPRSLPGSPLPILIVVSRPQYRRAIDLHAIGERIVDQRLGDEFRRALDDAMRTAR